MAKKVTKQNSFFETWKIGTNIKSYLEKVPLFWLKNNEFLEKINNNDEVILEVDKDYTFNFRGFSSENKKANDIFSGMSESSTNQRLNCFIGLGILKEIEQYSVYKINNDLFNGVNDSDDFYLRLLGISIERIHALINKSQGDIEAAFKIQENDNNEERYTKETLKPLLLCLIKTIKNNEIKLKIKREGTLSYWDLKEFSNIIKNNKDIKEEINTLWEKVDKKFQLKTFLNVVSCSYDVITEDKDEEFTNDADEKNWREDNTTEFCLLNQYFSKLLKKPFEIPVFQRSYAWDENLVSKLLDDLFIVSFDYKYLNNRRERKHLSTIVFNEKRDSCQILDGQQRTITLLLILFAIYKLMIQNCNRVPRFLCELFKNNNILNSFKNYQLSESYRYLNELLSLKSLEQYKSIQKKSTNESFHIFKIFEFIVNTIEIRRLDYYSSKNDFYKEFYVGIMERTFITLSRISMENSLDYFLRVNTTAKPLSLLDIWLVQCYEIFDYRESEEQKNKHKNEMKECFSNGAKGKNEINSEDVKNYFYFLAFLHDYELKNLDNSVVISLFTKVKEDYDDNEIELKIGFERKEKKFFNYLLKTINIYMFISLFKIDINGFTDKKLKDFLDKIVYKNLATINTFVDLWKPSLKTVFHSTVFSLLNKFGVIKCLVDDYFYENEVEYEKLERWLFKLELFNSIWTISSFSGQSIREKMNNVALLIYDNQIKNESQFFNILFSETNIEKPNFDDFINKLTKDKFYKYKSLPALGEKELREESKSFQNLYKNIEYKISTLAYNDEMATTILKKIKSEDFEGDHVVALKDESLLKESQNIKLSIGNFGLLGKKSNRKGSKNTKEKLQEILAQSIHNVFYENRIINLNDKSFSIDPITNNDIKETDQFLIDKINKREQQIVDIVKEIYKYED
ncbi:MAG: DUF262 domain-containing protein [Mycoplasma sp.]